MEALNGNLVAEWHPTKNDELTLEMVTVGSGKNCWWLGKDCGHEWQAIVKNRVKNNSGCPYCTNQRVLTGFNDLATLQPVVAAQWHPTKNGELTSYIVSEKSNKKVWWVCDKGHEWATTVANRVNFSHNCPYCSGRNVRASENDIMLTNLKDATQWHPTKNGDLRPEQVSAGSHKRVWWLCGKGHEWESYVYNKLRADCPKCSSTVSKAEKELGVFFNQLGLSFEKSNRILLKGKEVDFYFPDHKIAIEFNGVYWHSEDFVDKFYHFNKWKDCKEQGIQLIQIWEDDWSNNPELVKKIFLVLFATNNEELIIQEQLFAQQVDKLIQSSTANTIEIISDNCLDINQKFYEKFGFILLEHIEPDYMFVVKSKRRSKESLTILEFNEINNLPKIWDAGKTRCLKMLK